MENRASIKKKGEKKAIRIVASIFHTKNIKEQYGFDWLRGDKGTKLPVDAYFPDKKLVLEYHGRQHFEVSKFMDKKPGRAEQRRKYTLKRQELIPKHGLKLLEIRYDEALTLDHIKERLNKLGYKI